MWPVSAIPRLRLWRTSKRLFKLYFEDAPANAVPVEDAEVRTLIL
jgi:hypothetical protein